MLFKQVDDESGKNSQLDCQIREAIENENRLIRLQLHQVQEELERYFFICKMQSRLLEKHLLKHLIRISYPS